MWGGSNLEPSIGEQVMLDNIAIVKTICKSTLTQITPFGLETITTFLAPSVVAILFCNNYFSTLHLYLELLQLL
jgi:ubiquitin carboxyl-terminal hydrolase MINDY-1/2